MTGQRTDFTDFFQLAEPRLKVSLCAGFGTEVGMEATSQALAYGWEHWSRVQGMDNPIGYLWKVGRDRARRIKARDAKRRFMMFDSIPTTDLSWVEPGLPVALSRLSERQRTAVVLVHGLGWQLHEVADLLGVGIPTVQTHADRGLARLQKELGVEK